jgi:CheY-like chemotaxis protein
MSQRCCAWFRDGVSCVRVCVCVYVSLDDPPLRRAALRLLKRLGVQESNVTFLCDGEAGLNYIQDRRNRPHVVLMDINMPKILGTEVMRQCGKQPYPIIAATGNVDPDSIAQYEALGFAGVLSKPFTGNDLKRALMKAVTIGDLNLLPAIADSEPVSDAVVSLVDSNFSNSGPGSSLVFENASSARSLPKDDSHSDG